MLAREFGLFTPAKNDYETDFQAISHYLMRTNDLGQCLEIIEMSFKLIVAYTDHYQYRNHSQRRAISQKAITKLNGRFP